jgi:metal-responsive CopG/Arc/MetJ family transcriptional regulator
MTVSLPPALLAQADALMQRLDVPHRSALVERALRLLVRQAREATIDRELDLYYAARTSRERAEERAMVRAFQRSQRRRDLDREGR